jgi:hypothetical protein
MIQNTGVAWESLIRGGLDQVDAAGAIGSVMSVPCPTVASSHIVPSGVLGPIVLNDFDRDVTHKILRGQRQQLVGQHVGRVHEREVAECLREVAELSLVSRVVLFGEQSEIVCGGGHSLE